MKRESINPLTRISIRIIDSGIPDENEQVLWQYFRVLIWTYDTT